MLADKLRAATGGGDPSWDLANAVYQGSPINYFSLSANDQTPRDFFFKTDGLTMYVIGDARDRVYQYTLSTAWDISTASYLQDFLVAVQELSAAGIFFKPDGLKMYIIGTVGDDINEYDLSTAWDISTASYLQNFSIAAQEATPSGIFFKPDGLKVYVVGATGDDINEYDLSTAWNITTASYLQNFSVAAQDTSPTGLFFKSDGLKMYVVGAIGRDINEYNLSTAWDITTASYLQNFNVSAQEDSPQGVFFKTDGLMMYVVGNFNKIVAQYPLTTAWDISTATYVNPSTDYLSLRARDSAPTGLFFKPDGLKMYFVGDLGNNINEYDLSTAWNISTASYLQSFSVSAQEVTPQDVSFKTDGLTMYVIGTSSDAVSQYTLSTAWDISTATYLQNFSVAAQDNSPQGFFFKPDGLALYVIGTTGESVYQYTLSSAWNISTASYLRSFSVAAQETNATGVFFKPDGLEMYVIGQVGQDVNQYTLSTAWNISTASYLQNFSVLSQEIFPHGCFFKSDGLKMYVIGQTNDAIWSYNFV